MTHDERKRALRGRVLTLREAMSMEERAHAARIVMQRITADPAYIEARSVLAYCSFGSELDTRSFLAEVLREGKMLILPRVERATGLLHLHRVTDLVSEMQPGAWGIPEPKNNPATKVGVGEVDFALVPGVAFDSECNRMGYGAGYYDRLFGNASRDGDPLPWRVSGAFDCQIVAEIPVSETDLPVHRVVTQDFDFLRRD